ncbi:poly adp-ribose polymerase member 14-like protein [Stylonychia lemnae]|uniref:Poly [ADP-ribose] polymerase n=1 Tax=Stylonychia lemnae TaxID=5949 RepID=A0A077ZVI5_STYLE|nr:poly adp-ribose polymerase member 14-like protein [Stylonychia lemnae]|eukprot:CDW73869.1 poly adp-ribose polymerase member 14-like protein [Stylonychia lemnae]
MERIDETFQIGKLSKRKILAGQCDIIHQNQNQSQLKEPPRRESRGGAMMNNDGTSIVNDNQDYQNNHRERGGEHRGRGNDNHRGVQGGYRYNQEDGVNDTIQENDQIRGGSSYQGRGGRDNHNRGGNYIGRGGNGTFSIKAYNVETTSNNQRRDKCNNGKNCRHFAQGNCRFFHSPSHFQVKYNSDAQSTRVDVLNLNQQKNQILQVILYRIQCLLKLILGRLLNGDLLNEKRKRRNKKDEIVLEYDSSSEKWVEADLSVQKYMLQRIKHIVKNTNKNDVERMTNLRSNRNNNNTISIYGFRIDNDKLMKIKNLLEQYQFTSFKMDYAIYNKARDISENLVHVFHYLKDNQIIEDILKDQYPPIQYNVYYDKNFLQIKVNITLSQYKDIINQVKSAVKNIQTKRIRISNYFIATETKLHNDKTIQKILEDKFDIKMTDTVHIFEMNDPQQSRFSNNRNYNQINQRLGKKGWRYDKIDEKQKKIYEMKDYEIQLTGPDLDQAEQFLINKLSQIDCQKITLNQTNNKAVETKAKDSLQQVQQEYGVLICFNFPTIYSVGKQTKNRLKDALKKFVDLEMEDQKARQRKTKQIIMQDAPNSFLVKILDENIRKIQQIETEYCVRVHYNKNWFYISGTQQDCEKAGQDISLIQLQLSQDIINKQISNKDLLKAIHMKGIQQCESQFYVYITSETIEEQQHRQRSLINYANKRVFLTSLTENYQWFYAVRPYDDNYNQRPNKNEDWFPLDPDQNRQIEGHYKECCSKNVFSQKLEIIGDQDMQKNGFYYEVWGTSRDPSSWYEKNTQYNNPRQLHRKNVQVQEKQSSYLSPNMLYSDRMNQNNQQNNPIQKKVWSVKGKRSDVQAFEEAMMKYVNDPTNHQTFINLRHYDKCAGKINSVLFNELKQIAQIKFNTLAIFDGDGTQITLQGLKCKDAQVFIEKILKFANEYNVPDHWEQFDKMIDRHLLVLDVQQGTNAWNMIQNQFMQTMPNSQILKIQKIQNKKLWRTFTIHLEDITDKHQGKQKNYQLMLYHGTRSTTPVTIYDSEEGFNMLYSSGGMWGQACYFAEKASYSHDYRHTVRDGTLSSQYSSFLVNQKAANISQTFQMFFARVTVGEFKKLDPNRNIKMPPPMEWNPQLLYDSVQGEANGSTVYMIYQNKKAYPEYLITYK